MQKFVYAFLRLYRLFKSSHRHGEDAVIGLKRQKVLVKKADSTFIATRNIAAVSREITVDKSKKGGFSLSIQSD